VITRQAQWRKGGVVQFAAIASQIIDSIVSDIDTNDLESVRNLRAAFKKTSNGK
jgi:hypothetical protein